MSNRKRVFMSLIILDLIVLILLLFFSVSFSDLKKSDTSGIIKVPTIINEDESEYYYNKDLDVTIKFNQKVDTSNIVIEEQENNLNIKNFIISYDLKLENDLKELIEWVRFPNNLETLDIVISTYNNNTKTTIDFFNVLDGYIYVYRYADRYVVSSKTNDVSTTKKTSYTSSTKTITSTKETTTKTTEITDKTTNKISTTKTTKITDKTTIKTSTTKTTKITTTTKKEEIEQLYYYEWTSDTETDFSGRNCLFLYKIDGTKVVGEVELIYYNKYVKNQKISTSNDDCFLEDKKTVKVNAIIINGERYEKIDKE